ncbi:DUF892 family protein [Candidatus Parcubacteria bacterium]|nr:DUF892 family protein [Candidatus Parcubacteria bacterium]
MAKAKKGAQARGNYSNLHQLLILKLEALYDVERELVKVLPKLAKNATSDELREAFEMHLEETEIHVERLEEAMDLLDVEPRAEKVEGIRGIAEDGSWVIKNIRDDAARDAALIAAAQYAEHFEIAGYGSAREWARLMGHTEVEELLSKTLEEEEAANEKLTELAEGGINERANADQEQEEAEVM